MSVTAEQPASTTRWYSGITARQWFVLVIASAGWVFDVYEGQLFTVFKTVALGDLLTQRGSTDPAAVKALIDWHANIALALFLVGGAIGGLGFGILADRYGRVRVLSWTILTYSVFSALTAFAQSIWQIHLLRALVALGAGGEWAVAAALVAESFPPQARAFASGTFHASSVLGAGLASITGLCFVGEHAWRWGFMVGLAPALLLLWIRMSLTEPGQWQKAKTRSDQAEQLGSLGELLRDARWRPRALLALGLATVGLATYWGIFAWAPELVGEILGPSASKETKHAAGSFAYLLMNLTGGLAGLLAFAPLSAWKGRRAAFAAYFAGAFVTSLATFLGARTHGQVLVLLPVMAFFVVGLHAGYAVYFPELFPTRLRATGSSFGFNLGRLLGAGMLIGRGALGATLGLRYAVVVMSSLFLVGLALLALAPETRGEPLPE